MRLAGKHVVITGGASGLGAAVGALCLAEGATVTALDLHPAARLDTRLCDVGDEEQVRRVFGQMGRVDALVNCAGIVVRLPVDETPMTDFDAVMRVNLRGSFLSSKYALPLLKAQGGSILHFSSCVALMGTRGRAAYIASKGAIIALTRNMALDYAADRVRVNCLCPGFTRTPILAGLEADAERLARVTALHPLGRLGEPEDIAKAALFLISDDASWITGQAIAVDGGYSVGHMADI